MKDFGQAEESKYFIPLHWDKYEQTAHEFEINDAYLEEYDSTVINSVDVFLRIAQKQITGSIELNWFLDGSITLDCDTCLEPVQLGIRAEQTYYVKQDSEEDNSDDAFDIIHVHSGEKSLNIGDFISEHLHVEIPIQVTCKMDVYSPKECNKDMTKFIAGFDDEVELPEDAEESDSESGATDPRWDALKQIQFKNTEDGTSETKNL